MIDEEFAQLVLLDEQSFEDCVIAIEPVLVLTKCAAEDIHAGGLDGIPQTAPAVLHGGVLLFDWKVD
ncbi:unnamed protein product [Schistocephalus solidus]|uniref:Uncharacterized protein n=1 Tax=Schistocephalus solidus TaxID=70667 RepID=A0A183SVP4_SCHSO|nr:unnamed protein product [Schistocephalus solidus]